jgi:hypothetical protein
MRADVGTCEDGPRELVRCEACLGEDDDEVYDNDGDDDGA